MTVMMMKSIKAVGLLSACLLLEINAQESEQRLRKTVSSPLEDSSSSSFLAAKNDLQLHFDAPIGVGDDRTKTTNVDYDHRQVRAADKITVKNTCGVDMPYFWAFALSLSTWTYKGASSSYIRLNAGASITITSPGDDAALHFYGLDRTLSDVITPKPTDVSPYWSVTVNGKKRPFYVKDIPSNTLLVELCGGGGGYAAPAGGIAPAPTPSPTKAPTKAVTQNEAAALASCPSSGSTSQACVNWLTAHNSRRLAYHTSLGYTPRLLVWDTALAAEAQAYANTFLSGSSCRLAHDKTTDDGENLASNWGTGSYRTPATPEQVLVRWWDKEYDILTSGNSFSFSDIGHFTQAAWYNSGRLGCASISKSANGGQCNIQVCRYAIRGNCNLDMDNLQDSVMHGDCDWR